MQSVTCSLQQTHLMGDLEYGWERMLQENLVQEVFTLNDPGNSEVSAMELFNKVKKKELKFFLSTMFLGHNERKKGLCTTMCVKHVL